MYSRGWANKVSPSFNSKLIPPDIKFCFFLVVRLSIKYVIFIC